MEFDGGNSWKALLFGSFFALLFWPCLALVVWLYVRRLLAACGLRPLAPTHRPGAAGLLRDTASFLVGFGFFGVFVFASILMLVPPLTNHFPALGTAHPVFTEILRWKAKPQQIQHGFEQGLARGDADLVKLALALGAQDRLDVASLLLTQDPAMRELLLAHGMRPDGNLNQQAPLARAVDTQHLDDWRWLLAHGARRGLVASWEQPQPLLHALALAGAEVDWLEAALQVGIDPNTPDSGGAGLLDVLELDHRNLDWREPLQRAGGFHLLPLAAPGLPIDHPAGRTALQWLQANASERRWTSKLAAAGSAVADEIQIAAGSVARIQGDASQVLVYVPLVEHNPEWGEAVLRLLPRQAEAGDATSAEAPAADAAGVTWMVAGVWLDLRQRE